MDLNLAGEAAVVTGQVAAGTRRFDAVPDDLRAVEVDLGAAVRTR